LKTHIRIETAKYTIPRNVDQLKLRNTYFHPQIENYYKSLNYQHIKAYFTMNKKKRFLESLMLQRIIRIVLKTHIWIGTAKSMIPSNVHQLKLIINYFHPQIENYYK
jgi:hypothetical protein